MNTVIFLDIDGVLNCGDDQEPAMAGSDTVFWPTVLKVDKSARERTIYFLNRERVKMFADFINPTDVGIVISSSWRCFYNYEELCDIFDQLGIKRPIGVTPQHIELSSIRGLQINEWLVANPHITRYAIIDDANDMTPEQMQYLVHTTWIRGLCPVHIDQLRQLLLTNDNG